jgi:uncharacterized phiE125 gp8 family phage protein
MTLTLITPPASPVVSVSDLKSHLRVDYSDHDQDIEALERAAVGYLDGWRGVLGRALLQQVWRQEFCGWGTLELALPDVSAATVTYLDANDAEQPATTAVLRAFGAGFVVDADGPNASRIFVNMTCAMPQPQLQTAKTAIKMIVAHWYRNSEAVAATGMESVPMSADALIASLRWNRL